MIFLLTGSCQEAGTLLAAAIGQLFFFFFFFITSSFFSLVLISKTGLTELFPYKAQSVKMPTVSLSSSIRTETGE